MKPEKWLISPEFSRILVYFFDQGTNADDPGFHYRTLLIEEPELFYPPPLDIFGGDLTLNDGIFCNAGIRVGSAYCIDALEQGHHFRNCQRIIELIVQQGLSIGGDASGIKGGF